MIQPPYFKVEITGANGKQKWRILYYFNFEYDGKIITQAREVARGESNTLKLARIDASEKIDSCKVELMKEIVAAELEDTNETVA